jgi:hypothetical protein
MNSTFYIGLGFVQNEQEESFRFNLSTIQEIGTEITTIPSPVTVVIDKDRALINALYSVFPEVNILICMWHIYKNILSHAK